MLPLPVRVQHRLLPWGRGSAAAQVTDVIESDDVVKVFVVKSIFLLEIEFDLGG
jgi:hypothetical protein